MALHDSNKPIPISDLNAPDLYLNRELSLLEFHKRVLHQSMRPETPLLERLRFLTISTSILDEFFEVRAAGLKEQISLGLSNTGPDGMGPSETLARCREIVLELVEGQYRNLHEIMDRELPEKGIVLYRRQNFSEPQIEWAERYFEENVLPVLTPIGLDPAHPFPRILNKSLNFIVSLEGKDAFGRKGRYAIVQAPRVLPRVIRMPDEVADVAHGFMLLSSMMHLHVEKLFPGMRITECHQFRATRNSNLWIHEDEVQDFLHALKGELPQRHFGSAVRLEVSKSCPDEMVDYLLNQFELKETDLYRVDGPVNLHRLEEIYDLVDRPELKYTPFIPGIPSKLAGRGGMFDTLRKTDVFLHHPYQGFGPVLDLLHEAAEDPHVMAIKITIYRTGIDSPITKALIAAARAGKEVTCIVELRARFDEAANIELASRLQEAGAKVVYGVVGFKAHAKMILVVRKEANELKRYVHLGTGNYNVSTAKTYTDFGLMTSDPEIGEDVHALFQQLTGVSRTGQLKRLIQTPFDLHKWLIEMIHTETENARKGKDAWIVAKMNSLVERGVIHALYRASQAGVRVNLVVRGICCLKPGITGVSENIQVRSIVGRFLEHHRLFSFCGGGRPQTYCSSADWMPRNFFRRVEIAFPVRGKKQRSRVMEEGIQAMLEDNCTAWEMLPDGTYSLQTPGSTPPFDAQDELLKSLCQQYG